MLEPLITEAELAARWNILPYTLSQWRWAGKGPRHVKIGRQAYYRVQDINQYEEQKAKKSTSYISDEENSTVLFENKFKKKRKFK